MIKFFKKLFAKKEYIPEPFYISSKDIEQLYKYFRLFNDEDDKIINISETYQHKLTFNIGRIRFEALDMYGKHNSSTEFKVYICNVDEELEIGSASKSPYQSYWYPTYINGAWDSHVINAFNVINKELNDWKESIRIQHEKSDREYEENQKKKLSNMKDSFQNEQ